MLIKSLLHTDNTIHSTSDIKAWIEQRNREVKVQIDRVPFSQLDKWHIDSEGSVRHDSGKFFSIEGIRIETDYEEDLDPAYYQSARSRIPWNPHKRD